MAQPKPVKQTRNSGWPLGWLFESTPRKRKAPAKPQSAGSCYSARIVTAPVTQASSPADDCQGRSIAIVLPNDRR